MTKKIMNFSNFESGKEGAREVLRSTDDPKESIDRLLTLMGIDKGDISPINIKKELSTTPYSVYQPGVGYRRNGD